jgi:hypothetical protein
LAISSDASPPRSAPTISKMLATLLSDANVL